MEMINLQTAQNQNTFTANGSKFAAPNTKVIRKIIVKGEFTYVGQDSGNIRVLGECSFTVGDISSISCMLDQIIEQVDHNIIAIKEGARFFNIRDVKFTGFPITIENEDGSIFDEIEFIDQERLEDALSLVAATV